ncbi:PAS domain-containing protein [Hymenobacter endophyticus]|uniref:histidine kinase n=1 Tax=Hymenobacter endophyticus TaxID=3076335 RepID=A0ABU3TBN9_9BACT|nr:PAS domain-containing protein [Hymenobacter endophyticus]MDU0368797.1 PAS domain-containing protein [Hymenobacter endophyticus]
MPSLPAADALFEAFFDLSLTGGILCRPLLHTTGEVVDFAFERLNPVAQRLLKLPAQPTRTLRQHFPEEQAAQLLAFLQEAYQSPEARELAPIQLPTGTLPFSLLVARRVGEHLVVSWADAAPGSQSEPTLPEYARQPPPALASPHPLPGPAGQLPQLSHLLEQVPAAIATLSGPDHRYTFASAGYHRLVGQPTLLGRTVAEALPELMEQGLTHLLDQVRASGEPYAGQEKRVLLRNPVTSALQPHYLNFMYQPLRETPGQTPDILVFVVDVTEQVEARQRVEQLNQELETRVRERTQQLAEQQHLLRQILRHVPAAIATLGGPEHRYTFFNEPYHHLSTGRASLGETVAEVFPEVVEQGFTALLDQVYTTGEAFIGTDASMQLFTTASGHPEQRYIDFIYQPLFDDQGRTQGILAFILDVTDKVWALQQVQHLNQELQATNKELNISNTRLSRTNADLDTFVYTASHDLKAPIANIEGLLETLREYLPAPNPEPMVPRLLDMMQSAVARFQQTVGHLTDVSRLQHSQTQPAEAVFLATVVEDVLLDLAPLVKATNAQLVLSLSECPLVYFSAKDLRSILYNLLSNALKYHHPQKQPVVQLRAYCSDTQIFLEVEDNGLGLNEQQQAKLFTLFHRLHNHVEGSGVGLFMIKRIVENAGGSITVHSQPELGSTFLVALPRI